MKRGLLRDGLTGCFALTAKDSAFRAVVGDVVRTVAPSTETTNEPAVHVICRGPNKRYG